MHDDDRNADQKRPTLTASPVARAAAPGALPVATPVRVSATFQRTPDGGLQVHGRIVNESASDVYVLDRLVRLERGTELPDPERAYRFVRDGSLRVLLGPAPLPRTGFVAYRNYPLATRVPAGGTRVVELSFPAPMKEYSPYFPETAATSYEKTNTTEVVLAVSLIGSAAAKPIPRPNFGLDVFKVAAGPAVDAIETVVTSSALSLQPLRRTDEISRLTLPGEQPARTIRR